jgi:tellurite resistance protein TehA-like permease
MSSDALAGMHPAIFAMAMATGIVSIAAHLVGIECLAVAFFAMNLVVYPTLWVLTLVRIARHRDRVVADLLHHGRSVGYFTTVAATCVLGTQFLLIAEAVGAAVVFWIAGVVLYAVMTYAIFTLLTVKPDKPALAEGINGGWLVAVVAAQSVASLGALLAPRFPHYGEYALFFSLSMWLGGGMLYIWIIGLIFYRYTFFPMAPADLAPPYWVNMGAAAISALAGATLVSAEAYSPVLRQVLPFVRGLTVLWWATATWWLPMLFILALWRHVYRKFPLRYDSLYWGAVFPLGMYAASTVRLSKALNAPFLMAVPRVFIYVALSAWGATMFGLVMRLVSLTRIPRRETATSLERY